MTGLARTSRHVSYDPAAFSFYVWSPVVPPGVCHHPVIDTDSAEAPVSAAALLSLLHRALSPLNLVS